MKYNHCLCIYLKIVYYQPVNGMDLLIIKMLVTYVAILISVSSTQWQQQQYYHHHHHKTKTATQIRVVNNNTVRGFLVLVIVVGQGIVPSSRQFGKEYMWYRYHSQYYKKWRYGNILIYPPRLLKRYKSGWVTNTTSTITKTTERDTYCFTFIQTLEHKTTSLLSFAYTEIRQIRIPTQPQVQKIGNTITTPRKGSNPFARTNYS